MTPKKPLPLLNEAMRPRPEWTLPGVERATYRSMEKFSEMLADADRAVANRPLWAVCHNLRGQSLYLLGRYDEAIHSLDRAIELDPH